ncbi:MAG: GDSL-type esterase/lipase family protein [Methanoregulaceae archaeon]
MAIGAGLLVNAVGAETTVLPLGDSITRGDATQGYRLNLWTQMVDARADVNMIGSLSSGGPTGFDRQHEGHSGYTVRQLANTLPSLLRQYPPPDIVLLHIGTNDLTRKVVTPPAAMKQDLGRIIETLRARNPSVRVFVAQIVPAKDPGANHRITEYNRVIREVANRCTTSRAPVIVVDMFSGFDRTVDISNDGVHPSRAGYRKMAGRWYAAIRPVLATWRPTQRPTPVTTKTPTPSRPYTRLVVPGTVQAEHYDLGGEGTAYHDTTPANEGGNLRRDGVDITTVPGTGPVVGYIRAGEWLHYTLAVSRAAQYSVSLRVSSPNSGTSIRLEARGGSTTTIPVPKTGSHERFTTVKGMLRLPAGTTILKVVPSGHQNVDWIRFSNA